MSAPPSLLHHAEEIARLLAAGGIPALLIGAGAMAAHHYVRLTRDLDLAVSISFGELERAGKVLRQHGWGVECRSPDADDPLDGVLDIPTRLGLVQVINFGGTFPAVIHDALAAHPKPVREGSPLCVIPLPHLIALKLYAGGHKSRLDLVELLRHNPEVNAAECEALCRHYRLRGLKAILREGFQGR